jgi:sugar phosphate isomerase/epimerase
VRVKAQVVVLHMGSLEMKDYTDKLIELAGQQKKESPKYQKLVEEISIKREEKKERPMQYALEVLRRLIAEAEPRGIKLGIENREAVEIIRCS